jgi:membrane protease YdiL (CAAX protease family)
MILRNRWGYFAVGLLAPISEELVFRGAILRALLRWTSRHWVAIAISAVLFALIHANPAQMPHAFLIGLLLGWLYYRTDSIVPGIVYHWVNNSVAYVIYNLYPDPSLKLIDLFGSQRTVAAAVLFSLFILLPALYQLYLRLKKA